MNELAFRTYLLEQKVDREQSTAFISRLEAMRTFQKTNDIEHLPRGVILQFTEHLVKTDPDTVLDTLRAFLHYGNFIEKYDYVAEVLDIAEAYNAMDTLYERVGEECGEAVRDAVFADVAIPPLGLDPETKSNVTKVVIQRLEAQVGEAKTIELLAPCLHGRPDEPKAREDFLRLNDIDEFLALKHQELF